MNISITFRHMDASEAIKSYASDKVSKLQKFLRKPMTAKVTLSLDKLRHVAETRVSSGGEHLEAKETSEDMYASIDRVIDKLERQIRGSKGAAKAKKRRRGDKASVAAALVRAASSKSSRAR
jgi:putative sigma-54 modulation protein